MGTSTVCHDEEPVTIKLNIKWEPVHTTVCHDEEPVTIKLNIEWEQVCSFMTRYQ